jgi:Repeat of unknown function (DUF346)
LLLTLLGCLFASTSALADVHSFEVKEYSDEFAVPAAQAEQTLETQERGAGISEALQQHLGTRYAGVWFDNESGEFVVPTVAGANRAVVTAGLSAEKLNGNSRTVSVESTWAELEAAQARLNAALNEPLKQGLVQTALNPETNAVVVREAKGLDARLGAQIKQLAALQGVHVEVQPTESPSLHLTLQSCKYLPSICDAPMRGGVDIQPSGTPCCGAHCTAGFKGIGDTYGNRFVITAGHCYAREGGQWLSFTSNSQPHYLGAVQAATFPVHDYAAINASGNYWDTSSWPNTVVNWGVNQEYPITTESSSYVGEYVCHIGAQSGKSCGTVSALHHTSTDEYGELIYNLTEFGVVCGIGGDSGGPVFAGNTALGIMSSIQALGSEEEYCRRLGYYNEITEATDAMAVHVAPRIAPPPSWHPAESLGGTFTSDLDVASWGPGRLDIFGRGAENALWHKWWNGVTWGPWEYMGGNLASGPSAVSWGNNRIDVVARATDNTILHWWWDGAWHSDNLGGNIASNPDISSWGPGRLDIFGRGPENALWHRAYDGAYFPWENLGGNVAGGPGAVSWAPGRMDIAIRNPSGSIAHWYWLSGWHTDSIPGVIYSDPDLSSWGPGRLDLFAKGPGSELKHLWWQDGVGWSTVWDSLGGPVVEGSGAVSWGLNRIDVVGRGADNSALHWYWGS